MEKSLIVLDLDGTLILRHDKSVLLRKGYSDFFEYIFNNYRVAIYTSITKKNLITIIHKIFTDDQIVKLEFIFDREYTIPDTQFINKWDTLKSVNKIREIYPNLYNKILLLDDDERKIRFIANNEKLIVKKFKDKYENYNLKELIPLIKNKLNY